MTAPPALLPLLMLAPRPEKVALFFLGGWRSGLNLRCGGGGGGDGASCAAGEAQFSDGDGGGGVFDGVTPHAPPPPPLNPSLVCRRKVADAAASLEEETLGGFS